MIQLGQDAVGGWAWMIFDDTGELLRSGQDYQALARAMLEVSAVVVELQVSAELGVAP